MAGNNKQIILNEKSDTDVLEEMVSSNYGEHNILVYPDKTSLREIYSCYCKSLFEYNNSTSASNEMVLLIPFYETVQGVIHTLRKRAGIDVEKFEKDGSLVIIDSFEAYSRSPYSNNNTYKIVPLFKLLLQQAEIFGKKGISIISDLGLFYQFQQTEELIKHETSFAQKTNLKCKAFCSYRRDYFDMLTEYQKQNLLTHHFKDLVVTAAS
jgi:MEDS: MEthanogen/methylotroph, DcmR Sensory domain